MVGALLLMANRGSGNKYIIYHDYSFFILILSCISLGSNWTKSAHFDRYKG